MPPVKKKNKDQALFEASNAAVDSVARPTLPGNVLKEFVSVTSGKGTVEEKKEVQNDSKLLTVLGNNNAAKSQALPAATNAAGTMEQSSEPGEVGNNTNNNSSLLRASQVSFSEPLVESSTELIVQESSDLRVTEDSEGSAIKVGMDESEAASANFVEVLDQEEEQVGELSELLLVEKKRLMQSFEVEPASKEKGWFSCWFCNSVD